MVTAMQVAGLALTAVLLAKLLQRYAAEQALLLTLLLGTLLTCVAIRSFAPILNQIDALLQSGGLNPSHTAILSKAMGICVVTQLAADICKDAGETALGSAVTLFGAIALLLLCIPLTEELLALIREVLACVPSL